MTTLMKNGKELMINIKTGECFLREVDEETKFEFAERVIDDTELSDEEKIESLSTLGYELDDMVDLIFEYCDKRGIK